VNQLAQLKPIVENENGRGCSHSRGAAIWNMTFRRPWFVAILATAFGVAPLSATSFFFTTGSADGKLASLSQPSTSSKLETETADDFILSETTVIRGATITGLVVPHATLASIDNVEVEIHRVFPNDSQPPSAACRRE
jgi:hypothetical protein